MSKVFVLPLSLLLTALVLTGCPSGTECEGAECEVEVDAGTDAGTEADAGEELPCDGACSGATPICDTSVTGGVCVGCLETADCSGTATCDTATKTCVTCTTNDECAMGEVCDTSVAGGACVECTGDADCAAGVCDTATNACVTCTADGAGCATGEVCDTSTAAGQCVTCTATAGCMEPQFCDVSVTGGACVNCTTDGTGCAAGQSCDTTVDAAGQCFTCRTDTDCGADELCDTSVAGGACVGCFTDADCTDASLPVCEPSTQACRARTPADTSVQIQAVRDAADGASYMLPVQGAIVTYLKPATGSEPASFFVQAEQAGPALVVELDPATTANGITTGDQVSFVVNEVTTLSGGVRAVTAVSSATVDLTGQNVAALVQDVNSATDLTPADSYESEVVLATLTLTGSSTGAGFGFVQFPVDTTGMAGSADLRLRVPNTLVDSLELVSGCSVALNYGPVWRFNATTQLSAFTAADFSSITCPAPTLVSAAASSLNSVRVEFDRSIDPASVLADGSQFTFMGGISASAAVVDSADPTIVIVTTNEQTPRTAYEVSAAATILDTLGAAVVTPNSAPFQGYVAPASLLINEVNQAITGGRDLVELLVVTAGSTVGIELTQHSSGTVLATLPDVEVAVGDLIVVHLDADATDGPTETMAKDESPNATWPTFYDTAWDFRGNGTTHITNSGQVLSLTAPNGTVMDAIPFTNASPPGSFTTALQAIQAAGLWLPADCGGAPCSSTSTPTHIDVSVDWRTVSSNGSNSVQRVRQFNPITLQMETVETNQNSDWTVAAETFGAQN